MHTQATFRCKALGTHLAKEHRDPTLQCSTWGSARDPTLGFTGLSSTELPGEPKGGSIHREKRQVTAFTLHLQIRSEP